MVIIARESFSTYGENKCMIFKGAIAVLPDDQADTLIMEGKAYKYDEGRGPDTDYVPGVKLLYSRNFPTDPTVVPIENEIELSISKGSTSATIFAYTGDPSNIDPETFLDNVIDITNVEWNSNAVTVSPTDLPGGKKAAVVASQVSTGIQRVFIAITAGGRIMTFTAICGEADS